MLAVTMPKRLSPSVAKSSCVRCEGRRLVFNQMLGKSIPCPECARRARRDSGPLQDLTRTAALKRKENRLVARAVALAIMQEGDPKLAQLDAYFATTDRIMQRWAVGMGDGISDPDIDPVARPPALDDATQVVVDQIVQHSNFAISGFLRQWYCSPVPCRTMAEHRGIAHSEIYRELKAVLSYLRFRFETSGHADLIALVKGQL